MKTFKKSQASDSTSGRRERCHLLCQGREHGHLVPPPLGPLLGDVVTTRPSQGQAQLKDQHPPQGTLASLPAVHTAGKAVSAHSATSKKHLEAEHAAPVPRWEGPAGPRPLVPTPWGGAILMAHLLLGSPGACDSCFIPSWDLPDKMTCPYIRL